jgi:hypothetical protein
MTGDDESIRRARIVEMQRDLAALFALWRDVDTVTQVKVLKHALEDLAGELRRELFRTFGTTRRR